MQFPATLVQLAEKPPASPQQPVARQWNLFRLNLFISCNFRQLWLSWQKNPHSQQPDNENFLGWIHPFHAISSNFGSAGRKAPCSPGGLWPDSEIFSDYIHFMQFPANLVQLAKKPPHPPSGQTMKIFRLDLSISCNFQQLWFSW